ncbi:MAG: response regulator [Planctomycetes bacterium]|nr:response regulator [Planctomycetota bacterium]MCW8141015.1 response regulator [Planctomycetota bacterium]
MSEAEGAVLVVDDDVTFRTRLVRAFQERGFAAHGAGTHAEALDLARSVSPDLAVVDLRMAGESGLDVVRDLKALDATTRVLVLTGYGSIATAIEAVRLGAEDYLTKPADADQLLGAFERAQSKRVGAEPPPPGVAPSLARVEWEHIQRVLQDCEGNITKAARILGIHRRSLQRKLANYPPYR